MATVKTANQLGCPVEELVGRAITCPPEKLGQIIGKKGRHLQQLATSASVQMEVNKSDEKNTVRIVGPLASLDAAVIDLDKVFQQTEEKLNVDDAMLEYLTTKGVTTLHDIRASHPDVRLEASREKGLVCRGTPEDIAAFRQDLPAIQASTLTVASKDAAVVVGKNGATIENIVETHQTAIQLVRGENDTIIKVIGPTGHVEAAIREIGEILAANREGVTKMIVPVPIKNALLLENGKGIRELSVQVNADLVSETNSSVILSFEGSELVARGKSRVLEAAVEKVQAELRRLEQLMVSIQVDPIAIPVFIGKGGSGIKALKDEKPVTIELDKEAGRIDIAGLEASAIDHVRERIEALANTQLVERIQTDPPSAYKSLIGGLVRTQAKEVNKLVFMKLEDESQQIVLRGSRGKLEEAKVLIHQYFAQNYAQDMEVTKDDIQVLLAGGKNSKIVELAEKAGVKLNTAKDRQVIVVRGEKEKVAEAIKLVKSYLYGGEGMSIVKISIDRSAVGLIIGKGGKNKEELEQKYNVSITIHRNENVLTLRGLDAAIEACRTEIMKQMVTARVTHSLNATSEEIESLQKKNAIRRVMQSIPVHVSITPDNVAIRGFRNDVSDAVAVLNEILGKSYIVSYPIDGILFHRLQDAWKDTSWVKRIESESHAKLQLTQNTVAFTGSQNQVIDAKRETLKYFEFLFGSQFCHLHVSSTILTKLGKSGVVMNIMASSGCQLILDRDISAILFFCSDANKVEVAREAIKVKIEEENKRAFVLKLDDSEEWIVSIILGKNGSTIKSLRKETGCKIDVHDRIITITADQDDLVANARVKVESIVEKARRECIFVSIPAKHMPAFVGRSGANITKFSTEHGVEVQIMKKGTDEASVRLNGKEEAVSKAHDYIIDWLDMRETLGVVREFIGAGETSWRKDQPTTIIQLETRQIPRIIGKNGTVINGLQNEFNCEIKIDREMSTVTIRAEDLDGVTEKIQKILREDPETVKTTGTLVVAKGASADKPMQLESDLTSTKDSGETENGAGITIQSADFPMIAGDAGEPAEAHAPHAPDASDTPIRVSSITWATVTKPLTGPEYEISFDE